MVSEVQCWHEIPDGVIWKPNKALSTELILKTIKRSEEKRMACQDKEERHRWTVFVAYIVLFYVISLRGSEGFFLNLKSLRKLRESDQ